MTDTQAHRSRTTAKGRLTHRHPIGLSLSESITLLLSALLLWFVIKDTTASGDAARIGLLLAARSVVPALFPFLVLASLLTESGLGERIGRKLSRVTGTLFGISGVGASAFLLGAFCGFPVGARIVSSLYGEGTLSKTEAERLLFLSNGPSFAFLFAAVGGGFFRDRGFGLTLYLASVASTILIGIALRFVFGVCERSEAPLSVRTHIHPSSLFVSSVVRAGETAVTVSAFVVFFSVLSSALDALLSALGAPPALSIFLSGLLELSRGTKNAAETVNGLCGRALCGFFAGWGGLCAHLQVIATAERQLPDRARRNSLSFRSYFLCKFLTGLLCALAVWLVSAFS
ncbi:MAG: hypothetical protein IKC26_01640 [Clostridia bacterium]|nr:hypothetical protein [Clostridia bacterium]